MKESARRHHQAALRQETTRMHQLRRNEQYGRGISNGNGGTKFTIYVPGEITYADPYESLPDNDNLKPNPKEEQLLVEILAGGKGESEKTPEPVLLVFQT